MSNDEENISSDIILYSDETDAIKAEVLFRDETFWLNQKKLAELFQVDCTVITKHLKITDIYQQCSIDYNKEAEITVRFFSMVQNKLHWAVTCKTASQQQANSLFYKYL